MSIEAYEKLESSLTQLLHNLRKNVTSSGYWPEANRGMSFDLLSRSLRPVYIWARAGLVTSLLFFACVFPVLASKVDCPGRIDLDIAHGPVQSGHTVFYLT